MILTRDQALKAAKRRFTVLAVPELGGELRLGSLTAGAALKLREASKAGASEFALSALMLANSVCDEAGGALFDDATAGAFIGTISSETLGLIIDAIRDLGKEAAPAGNSPASPTAA